MTQQGFSRPIWLISFSNLKRSKPQALPAGWCMANDEEILGLLDEKNDLAKRVCGVARKVRLRMSPRRDLYKLFLLLFLLLLLLLLLLMMLIISDELFSHEMHVQWSNIFPFTR